MLLTLSVLMLAGGAFAADSDWSFYGVAHSSLNMLNNGEDSQLGLTSNTSRFGFKGTAPLNEDFTAFWQFESLVDMAGNSMSDDGDGMTIGTRNTYVGFKHATAGKLMMGRHDTPFKTLGRKVEMFPDQLGDFRSLTMGWDNRLTELLAYASPDWDGFSIFAAYQFDQGNAGAEEAMTAMSAMAAYSTEQFLIGAAYEGNSAGYGDTYTDEGGNVVYGDGPNAYRFVAKYMAPKFEVGGLYQGSTFQFDNGLDTGFDDFSQTVMGLGVLFKANEKWNIKGAMYAANYYTDSEDDADTADIDESDTTATQLAFGVDRIFTENVMVYFQYVMVGNGEWYFYGDDGPGFSLGGGQSGFGRETYGTIDTNGELQDPSGFSVGTVITW
jgi:predicted porin